ncbi:MFS transporter [Streptomyces sp. ISID311]|uniref:MFS transporter n=1 Tax=Streptomyces sp. ISID311 TaxID=2601673 RepID=UPI0011BD43AC|nr:MFS transporter [Streptomyces sp. ISID311]TXC93876.1 MFS transporter [Streptomyces sp. ISID311]
MPKNLPSPTPSPPLAPASPPPPAPPPVAPPAPYPRRWAALATLLTAEAMNLLDSTVTTVIAPVIHTDLGGPARDLPWFGAAYTLPFAVLLITGGRLGDIAGRRRVFRLGVAGFALASLLCALAPSAGLLIAARAAQGAAAALVIPQTIGLIRSMFHGAELPRALGSIGPVMGLAAVCGPVLGGALAHADLLGSSWRAAFLVNLPLALGVLVTARLLPEDRSARRPRLDLTGTALAVCGTGLIVQPLIASGAATGSPGTWGTLAAGLLVLAGFGLHQRRRSRRGRSVLVETGLFRDRGFPAALAASVLFFAVVNGLLTVVVLQLQLGPHTDVLAAGLSLLPWSAAMAVSSWIAGSRLVPRYGSRVMFAGLAALLLGALAALAAYGTVPAASYPWPLLAALAACGLGQGLFAVPFFTTALHRVRPHETGSAAGLLNAAQQLGGTLGIALLGAVFLHTAAAAPPAPAVAVLDGARHAFWAAVALLTATGLAAAVLHAAARTPRVSERTPRPAAGAGGTVSGE